MNDFMPKDYTTPKSSGGAYMKLIKWDNKFRILDAMLVGYVYFTEENKPVRSKEHPGVTPDDMKKDPSSRVKHFWAFPVWNYADSEVQILEISQVSIQEAIEAYVKNEKRGSPFNYDINVSKTGEKLETKYIVSVDPKETNKEATKAYEEISIDLDQLFLTGGNPFMETEGKKEEDMPF